MSIAHQCLKKSKIVREMSLVSLVTCFTTNVQMLEIKKTKLNFNAFPLFLVMIDKSTKYDSFSKKRPWIAWRYFGCCRWFVSAGEYCLLLDFLLLLWRLSEANSIDSISVNIAMNALQRNTDSCIFSLSYLKLLK